MTKLRARLARDEGGFTLIELLVVIIILAILMAIAIPSYLSFRGKADDTAGKAAVRAAIPAVEAYAGDHATGYSGMSVSGLQASYDQSLKNFTIVSATATGYCIKSTNSKNVFYKHNGTSGSSDISQTPCT